MQDSLLPISLRRSAALAALVLGAANWLMTGCQSDSSLGPIRTESSVDLRRFMGDWYVIAAIPTFLEVESYNAVESYAMLPDGRVATTFTFNKGDFDGPLKVYHPVGFVREGTGNAVWGMRFVWPIKAEYRIVYVDEAYSQTIIGRSKRDYVWIMARTPQIPEADYHELLRIVGGQGYDLSKIRKVPQQPRSPSADSDRANSEGKSSHPGFSACGHSEGP